MERIRYFVVGSGYRAKLYARVAAAWPGQFEMLGFLCRSEEKAEKMRSECGVYAGTDPEDFLAKNPDFAVIAVSKDAMADVAESWVRTGLSVVTETPAGSSVDKLIRLWELQEEMGARIQVCEQYWRVPILAAGLAAVAAGKIGTPRSAYLSLAHDYHGASMLRRMLQVPVGEPFVLHGVRMTNPVVETDSREGALYAGVPARRARDMVHLSFASGKEAIYDFSGVQYRSFIRSRHLCVRGERGEWSDTVLLHLDAENDPVRELLLPEIAPAYRALDTQRLRDLRRSWKPELVLEQDQDDFAVACHLLDMGRYCRGGAEAYPLAEALEDAYTWLLFARACERPWEEIVSSEMPWHTRERKNGGM